MAKRIEMTLIPEEKQRMAMIIIALRELTDTVALQSVIDAAKIRQNEILSHR
jgi:hypothetical protein